MQPFGLDAVELLRVEAGLIMVGVEFQGGDVSPYDLSLDRSILLGSDAEFVGRPALAAVAGDPPNRLKTVVVQGDTVPEYGAQVYRGDEVVGTLTSPVASPRFGVIGLARPAHRPGGQRHCARGRGRGRPVEGDGGRPVHPRPRQGQGPQLTLASRLRRS